MGISEAPGQQMAPAYYYPAPGYYATTRGTVRIPSAGFYLNTPLNAVPAPGLSAAARGSANPNPPLGNSRSVFQNRGTIPYSPGRYPANADYDDGPDPGWQFRL